MSLLPGGKLRSIEGNRLGWWWCRWKCVRCHTFITDGRIQFLGDCSHKLAGQTVDLPAWPEERE